MVFFYKKGLKYFIGYKDAKRIRPLCIFSLKMSAYRRDFSETNYIPFLINHWMNEWMNEWMMMNH